MTGLNKSNIPYLTHDCKAVRGCSPCSEACDNCWAAAGAWRMAHNPNPKIRERFQGLARSIGTDEHGDIDNPRTSMTIRFTGAIRTDEAALDAVLRRRKPAVIGMCFGGDLFHPGVPEGFQDQTFATMALAQQHVFIVPSKRVRLMNEYAQGVARIRVDHARDWRIWDAWRVQHGAGQPYGARLWPLSNVILLVTVWDQKSLEDAAPWIKELAAQGWQVGLSYEPALGPMVIPEGLLRRLCWVVAGCEQLAGGRPGRMAVEATEWMNAVCGQAQAAGVPSYIKQWQPTFQEKVMHVSPQKFELPEILRWACPTSPPWGP